MTYKEAMLLLLKKTSLEVEAAKILSGLNRGFPAAEDRAIKLIRTVLSNQAWYENLSEDEIHELSSLLPTPEWERKTEIIRFRCSPNDKEAIRVLAEKYADGNISRLIIDALNAKYPTL